MNRVNNDGNVVPSSSTLLDCSLLDSLECTICAVVFKDPKQLNCGHTFCAACISKLAQAHPTAGENAFAIRAALISCPQCRTPTPVPKQGIQHLVTNFIVKEMVSKMESMEIARAQSGQSTDSDFQPSIQCSKCPKRVPKEEFFVCATCRSKNERTKSGRLQYICSLCALKSHKDHDLIIFADLANDHHRHHGATALQVEMEKVKNHMGKIQSDFSAIYVEFDQFYKVLSGKFELSNLKLEELMGQIRNTETTPLNSDLEDRYKEAVEVSKQAGEISTSVSIFKHDLFRKLEEFSTKNVYEKTGAENENVFIRPVNGKIAPRPKRKPTTFKFANRNSDLEQSCSYVPPSNNS